MSASEREPAVSGRTWTTPAALAAERQAERAPFIEQSHLRCVALGLSRIERPDFSPLNRGDFNVARERNQRLFTHAASVMELLFEQIVDTQSMIVLTDARGTILHSVGDGDFLDRARKVALTPGVNWAEQSKGTNAIGTALFEEAPTLVHGSEHFMHANSFLTCSAAPIFDPRGNMLGVLDVTGDHRSYHRHTMGLVRMSARMIENHWLSADYGDHLRLYFHARPEFIGTLLEGIVVVAADGRILGGNRSALDQLDMSSAALRMESLSSLFGTTPAAVCDHFRAPLPVPMELRMRGGRMLYANARFNSPSRWLLSGLAAPETAALPAAASTAPAAAPAARMSALHYLRTGDPKIGVVVEKVQRVLNRDIPLLILGETGTGKELLARAVHHDSDRDKQPFVAVNCASIPESLIEAELFGYEDGAFTGARRKGANGRIVQASGGTLFLDEIGDMPLALQARLLRVLQERTVTPLGSQKSIDVDIAVIGATHRNLREMIAAGTFREDLYYRLNGLVVRLPALRERSDLAVIAQHLVQAERPQSAPTISAEVMDLFEHYSWPGNIRQLANVLRTAAVMAEGERQITEDHLSDDFLEDARRERQGRQAEAVDASAVAVPSRAEPVAMSDAAPAGVAPPTAQQSSGAQRRTLEEVEVETIRQALEAAGGNISVASRRLGISRNTIYRKVRWGRGDSAG